MNNKEIFNHKFINFSKIVSKKRNNLIFKGLVFLFASFAVFAFFLILFFVIYKSCYFLGNYSFWKFISSPTWDPSSKTPIYGILLIVFWTIILLFFTLIIAVPISFYSAFFVSEYLSGFYQKAFIKIIRILAGIPSVVFGLFAIKQISPWFIELGSKQQGSMLLAAIVLAFMSLPIMLSLMINAILNVSQSYRNAAHALGFSKTTLTFSIISKSASKEIITAVIMGIARIIGETMAVIMICGNMAPNGNLNNIHSFLGFIFASIRTLAGTIGIEILENTGPEHESALYTIGLILFCLVILINGIVLLIHNCVNKKTRFFKFKKIKITKKKLEHKSHHEIRNLIQKKANFQTKNKIKNGINYFFMLLMSFICVGFTLFATFSIIINGCIAAFSNDLNKFGADVGVNSWDVVFEIFLSTLILVFATIVISFPFCFFTSIWLSEYMKSKKRKIFNFFFDVMASTPSIIFGLFGLIFFVGFLRLPLSILTSSLTLTFLVLPLMIRALYNEFKSVSMNVKNASYALGASKFETIKKVILPNSTKGILTAVILTIARIIGESAPIYLTLGTASHSPNSGFFSPGTSLAVKIYYIFKDGSSSGVLSIAYILALITLVTIIILNLSANYIGGFFDLKLIFKKQKIKENKKWKRQKKLFQVKKNQISLK